MISLEKTHSNRSFEERNGLSSIDCKIFDALFGHPVPDDVGWLDVITLFGKLGMVEQKSNNDFVFWLHGQSQSMRKPYASCITQSDVLDLRRFLMKSSVPVSDNPLASLTKGSASLVLLVVMDHHEAEIYAIDIGSSDVSKHSIRPHAPHHFLHHLSHKTKIREIEQKSADDHLFYGKIACAVADSGRVVAIGRGTKNKNTVYNFLEYLRLHRNNLFGRVASEVVPDISSLTTRNILEIGRAKVYGDAQCINN